MRVLVVAAAAFACAAGAVIACGTFGGGDEPGTIDASSDVANDTASPPDVGPANDDGGADAGPFDAGCGPHLAFVTNEQLAGDFGGVSAGDALCAAAAADAGLSGDFIAWLAVKTDASVVAPLARLRPCGDIRLRGGDLVAIDPPRLATALATGISQNAFGETRSGYVWTGTLPDAAPSGVDCNGWTSTAGDKIGWSGTAGETTSAWTSATQISCAAAIKARLYCFER